MVYDKMIDMGECFFKDRYVCNSKVFIIMFIDYFFGYLWIFYCGGLIFDEYYWDFRLILLRVGRSGDVY